MFHNNSGLVVENLSKNFGNFKALNNINITFKENSTNCILGHNGAGKSTLINLLISKYTSSSGNIFFNGISLNNSIKRESIPISIGIAFPFDVLINKMTVY